VQVWGNGGIGEGEEVSYKGEIEVPETVAPVEAEEMGECVSTGCCTNYEVSSQKSFEFRVLSSGCLPDEQISQETLFCVLFK